MKTLLTIIAVLAVASCTPLKRSLQDDINDFLKLVPVDEIESMFYDYLVEDEEFQEVLDYVVSEEFTNLVQEVEKMPEVKQGLDFLESKGISAYSFVNQINEYLEIAPISKTRMMRLKGGLRGFLDEVKALIPLEEVEKMYKKKIEEGGDFAKLVAELKSPTTQQLVDKLMKNEKFQKLISEAERHKIDVNLIMDIIENLLGLKIPRVRFFDVTTTAAPVKTLLDDINDFIALIPTAQLKPVFDKFYETDVSFQSSIKYLLGEETKTFVKTVEAMPEIQGALDYLEANGVPARNAVKELHEFLEITDEVAEEEVQSPSEPTDEVEETNEVIEYKDKVAVGMKGFLNEIKALIPLKELKKLSKTKIATSPAYNDMIMQLKIKGGKSFMSKFKADPKIQAYLTQAKLYGIDVMGFVKSVSSVLGVKLGK